MKISTKNNDDVDKKKNAINAKGFLIKIIWFNRPPTIK